MQFDVSQGGGTINQVLVSVIVPIYKVESLLKRCLESLKIQSFSSVEFLLIDDGSPDKCGEICDSYSKQDARFRVFHKKNGGLASARNYGIERAMGDFLMFVDSDDWVSPNFCQSAYSNAISQNADIVLFQYQKVKGEEYLPLSSNTIHDGIKTREEALDLILSSVGTFAWNKIFRKSLFDGVRYPEGRLYESWSVTWKLICRAHTIYYSNEVLYYYYMRNDSISHVLSIEAVRDGFENTIQMSDGLKAYGYSSSLLELNVQRRALSYAVRIGVQSNDANATRVKDILINIRGLPKKFSVKQNIALKLFKMNIRIFDLFCRLFHLRLT